MKRQDNWYTASEYYRYEEKELTLSAKMEVVSRNIPLHQHEGVELLFLVSGSGEAVVNGITYEITNGSFLNLNPYHFYSIRVETEITLYSLSSSLALPVANTIHNLESEGISDFLYEGAPVIWCDGKRRERVLPLFQRILQETKEKSLGYRAISRYMFMELEELFQRYSLLDSAKEHGEPAAEWKAVNQVMLATHQNISLEELAKEYQMAPERLNQKIRLATGYSYRQLVHLSRMINACSLLEFKDLSIAFIAKLFCYTSLNTFYREFKKYTNMTPEEYRESGGKNQFRLSNQGTAMSVVAYIHNHYREKLDGGQVAASFHISEGLLHKIMKGCFGISFSEMLNEIRIHYACALLSATKMPVCDVAFSVGYESVATFNRVFKEKMLETASAYRDSMVE